MLTVIVYGICLAVILAVSLFGNILLYDMLIYWAIAETITVFVVLGCCIGSFRNAEKQKVMTLISAIFILTAMLADIVGTARGWWQGAYLSKVMFILLFAAMLVMILKVIPYSIRDAIHEKEMEAELQNARISIMLSQIQPHFIYNTLGTVEQLCLENPKEASEVVHNFSLYLRGNISELDSSAPIRLSQEMEHVRHYTDIEKSRFPDMTITYDLRSDDFYIPALTVQPLVENAIKHGLMGLESGGTVTVSTYETDAYYCVKVTDDGVGFDTALLSDNSEHIGIRNIRGRLEAMCGGTLTVESAPGEGTTALIQIPKEERKNVCNHRR